MKYRYAACLFFVAFIIQTTLMNIVSVFGTTPNLLLCLVVIFSFLYDENNYGLVLGVSFGLLYDICFSQYVGIAALAFFVISLAIMLVNVIMNKEVVFSVIVVTASSTVVYTLIYWGIMFMLGSNYSFFHMMRFLPLSVLYNTVIVIVLYYLMINKVIRHHKDRYYK
ncbi:MAG: rod shape-determining protein MreD [Clostridiales bacterium]|nr:rod shape-determining protein MreD [Clostridiales bacterium]